MGLNERAEIIENITAQKREGQKESKFDQVPSTTSSIPAIPTSDSRPNAEVSPVVSPSIQ